MEVEDITLMHRITTKGDELMASRPGILNGAVKLKLCTVEVWKKCVTNLTF